MKKHKRIEIGVILTFLAWTAAAAQSLHVSDHRHLPLGRALLAGASVGLAVVGLLTLVTALWSLIFSKGSDSDSLRRGGEGSRVTAVRFR